MLRQVNRARTLAYVYLENKNEGHNKFYEITLTEHEGIYYVVLTTWGRIGAKGMSQEFKFDDKYSAMSNFKKHYNTRLDHGYSVIHRRGY